MRPRSLQLKGFTVFRDMPQPVSFHDADLFALTGPTGAGKTSLLDAMCFALYGRVPRLDARAVEPVVSLGAPEARIVFEFSVGDDVYRAARVVRRTKTGATTPEARLELDVADGRPVVLASGADEVNETVAQLLGLSFDHFTKTVLLPQGAFAAFLHDTPAKRQDLLRTLLDVGVYERMRELAQERRSRAEGRAMVLARDLEQLSGSTEEAERAAAEWLETLTAAVAEFRALAPEQRRLGDELAAASAGRQEAARLERRLASLEMPQHVSVIAAERVQARSRLEAARESARLLGEQVVEQEKKLASLPDRSELTQLLGDWERRRALDERRAAGIQATDAARLRFERATSAMAAAEASDEEAGKALRALETLHGGAALAAHVEPGADCPVCLRPVVDMPEHPPLPDLDDARRTAERAATTLRSAHAELAGARAHLESCEETLRHLVVELTELVERLEDGLSERQAKEAVEEIGVADARLVELRSAERDAIRTAETVRGEVARIDEGEVEARRELSSVRDALSTARPPELELIDLEADWRALLDWGADKLVDVRSEIDRHSLQIERLEAEAAELEHRVDRLLVPLGIESSRPEPLERLVAAASTAELELQSVRNARATMVEKQREFDAAGSEAEVARSLALHLQASRFEGWLMEEALIGLVAGANALLGQLSSGAYSLQMAKRDFVVIDHHNADETRGVKTLSGGETFLVSLALALSLAEQIGGLATAHAARLESIFLDEGFGTLDNDTLDVVAAVIQELGASGRTVGIVTHVTELAEMVPTRFEVVRGPGGSAVRRIDT